MSSVFKDRQGRYMRIVFNGIKVVRLQDNHGNNYVMSQSQFVRSL
jgi:hypothetical protein